MGSWPMEASVTAKVVVASLVEHWRVFGHPDYAQFDTDAIFQGTHAHPDAVGRVGRMGPGLGVVPVFVPPREPGFLAGQGLVPVRARRPERLAGSVAMSCGRLATPSRRSDRVGAIAAGGPEAVESDLQARLKGRMVYLRRTDATGAVEVLGRSFEADRRV